MFEVNRRKQYRRLAEVLQARLRQNSVMVPEERQKLEQKISQCVKKLDLYQMLNLYCSIFPEDAKEIHRYF